MSEPFFSIITVTYNAARELPVTLRSVAEQTFTDYEHLIIDGDSTDGTQDLALGASNPRIVLDSRRDCGIYDAMNRGIGLARGMYLIFMNAGDTFYAPDTLAAYADAAAQDNIPGIIYGQTVIVDENRNVLGPRHHTAPHELTLESFKHGMLVCHQAMAVLKRIAPLYSLKYRYSADYEWVIRCLQHSRHNHYIDANVACYLKEGTTTRHHKTSLMERFHIMRYYYGTFPTIMQHLKIACKASLKPFRRPNKSSQV